MEQSHKAKISEIAAKITLHYERKTPFRIFHGTTNSTRVLSFKRDEMIDVSELNEIITIDAQKKTIIVEPNVPMDVLVARTVEHGLLPPVIPEFPGITVGGGIQGGAGESSSFKWGFLSQTVNWIEMILADGSIVRCSPTEHSDLFYGTAGASGTLGVISLVEIQLIPAAPYVQLTYFPVTSAVSAIEKIQKLSNEPYDFIDGIQFGVDHGVVIAGSLCDNANGKIQRFSRATDPWYYLHAKKIDASKVIVTEYVPLTDYLFRYDRGAFWVGRYTFDRFGVPFNRFTRWLLNPLLHTRELYKALQDSAASQEYVVQDLTVPVDKATDFLHYIHETTNIYPLWLCPVKPEKRSPLLCNGLQTPLAINIGIWGPRVDDYVTFIDVNRKLERKLQKVGGKKWMYAHSYYSKKEFWQIYDKQWYDQLRTKYHATTLPDIYEKTYVRERYAVSGRRGLFNTILGRAKLRVTD